MPQGPRLMIDRLEEAEHTGAGLRLTARDAGILARALRRALRDFSTLAEARRARRISAAVAFGLGALSAVLTLALAGAT